MLLLSPCIGFSTLSDEHLKLREAGILCRQLCFHSLDYRLKFCDLSVLFHLLRLQSFKLLVARQSRCTY